VNDLAGPVALALVGLWIAYLVPHKLRHRQQLLESRADDRYSEALRVVAVSRRPGRSEPSDGRDRGLLSHTARRSTQDVGAPAAHARPGLLTPGRGIAVQQTATATGGTTVDRPHATSDRLSADAVRRAAQARSAHAAAVARRGAAARRRAVLAGVLLAATVAGWALAGLATVTWVAGAVPSLLLVSVLVLGRRAVLAGRAADATWAATEAELSTVSTPTRTVRAAPVVTGRAVHPSDASTEVFARIVADGGESTGTVRHASTRTGATPVVAHADATATSAVPAVDSWSPVPVPRPTYTYKPVAPRRDPLPLGEVEGSTSMAAPAAPQVAAHDDESDAEPAPATGGIDLDAVLAKRRASGE